MAPGLYLGWDRMLPHRIRKYVESCSFVDIDQMVECLQKEYRRDYGIRKKKPFKLLVKKVYNHMLDNGEVTDPMIKIDMPEHECNDSEIVDTSEDDSNCNMMNQSVMCIYNKEEENRILEPSRVPQYFENSKDNDQSKKEKENKKRFIEVEVDDTINDKLMTKIQSKTLLNCNKKFDKIAKRPKDDSSGQSTQNKKKKKREHNHSSNIESEIKEKISKKRSTFSFEKSNVTFADIAGNDDSLKELARLLLHMSHPEIYQTLGVSPPRGLLLHGPPGCGKTLLGSAIAGQLGLELLKLVGPELVAGVSGESEKRVRDVFEMAMSNAPCVLFLDEIDAVAQKRENASKDMERRIVSQLLSCLDDLNKGSYQVFVIGATNKPDVIDPALRRAGRFDREICMGIPDELARDKILRVMCKNLRMSNDTNFQLIARLTPGYVGADLLSLCREASMNAVARILQINEKLNGIDSSTSSMLDYLKDRRPFSGDELKELSIRTDDFQLAVANVQPSAKREGFATIPDVTWDDVGALEKIREELSIAILGPVRNPTAFAALGLSRASGVLLAGPPGCGKTLLAKAIANESGINFISVKGPELLNMYVGESERAVRQCFERAKNSSPCVIFFDELDSLCPRRSAIESSSSARVVNQMLTELDGLVARKQVFVVAATNRPDIIDPAVLRPGRLDKTLYIGIPSPDDRVKILHTITKDGKKPFLDHDVCLLKLAFDKRCEGFSGADLSSLVREASLNAIRSCITCKWNVILPDDNQQVYNIKVNWKNFNDAFSKVSPSISDKDRILYEEMRKRFEG